MKTLKHLFLQFSWSRWPEPLVFLVLCLVLLLPLAGCATSSTATATSTASICAPWRAITYSGTKDTAATTRQVQVHNKTGQNLGCW